MARNSAQDGASIHFLRASAHQSDARAIHFTFRIDNYEHIQRAYGPEVARSALRELNRILVDIVGDEGVVAPELDGRLELLIWSRSLFSDPLQGACDSWIHSICAAIAMAPIECAGEQLHLALSGGWGEAEVGGSGVAGVTGGCALRAHECVRFCGQAPGRDEGWGARYRGDMAVVAELFGAIKAQESVNSFAALEGRISVSSRLGDRQCALAWQAVRGLGNAAGVLYHECLVRLIGKDGVIHASRGAFESLERLGLVRALDQYILKAVIAELESDPGVTLGVNISAQSAQVDGWWRDVEQRLSADRSVARRLVIEITETTALPSISAAAVFASRMRSLGCMIALDDFGTGFASIRQLLALKPDIAKIDRSFVARAEKSSRDRAAFTHLVGLANALVPTVIVEGVENGEQCRLALEAGAVWQQGYHHCAPRLARSWRSAAENPRNPSRSDAARPVTSCAAVGR